METKIIKARELFNTAHINEIDCKKLTDLTQNEIEPILKAYYAAGIMVSSKYIINPFKILKIFNAGKAIIEDLISENFDNAEMRYLRYSIQLNTPKFAGYYKNIEEDRAVVLAYLKQHPHTEVTKHMMVFLTNTNDIIVKSLDI